MPNKTAHAPGSFCWAELATSDPETAKGFYASLFGWDVEDSDLPGGGVYSTFKIDGRSVAASSGQQEEEEKAGIPPHWNNYISVEDADQTTKATEAAGGTVLAPPFDVMGLGRMAVLSDPTGAVFSIWQAKTHIGAQVVADDNTMSWNELSTGDAARAKEFYTDVFGWTPTDVDMPGGTYTTFKIDEDWAGGMMQIQPEWGEVPPHWRVYFQVADAAAIASKVKELGGQAMMEPDVVEGVGTIGVFTDPQGASFGVIQPEQQA